MIIEFYFSSCYWRILLSVDDKGKMKAEKDQRNSLWLMSENLLNSPANEFVATFQLKCYKSRTINEEECESTFKARSIYHLVDTILYLCVIIWSNDLMKNTWITNLDSEYGQICRDWVILHKPLSLSVPQLAIRDKILL